MKAWHKPGILNAASAVMVDAGVCGSDNNWLIGVITIRRGLSGHFRINYNLILWNLVLKAIMNGYQYLLERNRLMCQLEDQLKKLEHLPQAERQAETGRLQGQFDIKLKQLYAQMASEYPGERKVKARPLTDPR
ncbi:MAG: hypothetical protein ACREQN_01770 [Candidatus Binataceae bacterium]